MYCTASQSLFPDASKKNKIRDTAEEEKSLQN